MRLRLLPLLIVIASLALTARVGELWQGIGTIAKAQTDNRGTAADVPAAQAQRGKATGSASQDRPARAARAKTKRASKAGDDAQVARTQDQALPVDPFSMTDEEIELLQALAERRLELQIRGRQMDQREALLQAAEQRIEEKVAGLKTLEKSIQDLLLQQEDQTEAQIKSLVKIYESMKPKHAARIFDDLDMAILLPVAERMKERKLAPVLAKMGSVKAQALTTELSKRGELPMAKE